jgi:hypothetical protein
MSITEETRLQMLYLLAPVALDPQCMDKLLDEMEKANGVRPTPEEIMKHINLLRSVRGV